MIEETATTFNPHLSMYLELRSDIESEAGYAVIYNKKELLRANKILTYPISVKCFSKRGVTSTHIVTNWQQMLSNCQENLFSYPLVLDLL